MVTQAMIDEFLGHHRLALMRLSPTAVVTGARIDDELKAKGYDIPVVYLDDSSTDARLAGLPEPVEGLIVAVPKKLAVKAVQEAVDAKMPRIWIQNGCQTREAVELCETYGVPVVHGACVLMYAQPVQSFHAFHRWLWKTLGLLKQ